MAVADREHDGAQQWVGHQQGGAGNGSTVVGIIGRAQTLGALCRGKEKDHEGGGSGLGRVKFGVTRWEITVNTSKATRTHCNLETRMRF
jgi:hypothetical protein